MTGVQKHKTFSGRTPDSLSREEVVQFLRDRDIAARDALVARADVDPAILRFLAVEGGVAARRAVAGNRAAGADTDRLLADDEDDEVRVELARKIAHVLPDLPADAAKGVRKLVIDTLEALARDQLVRVRRVLAEEIKLLDCVPKKIVARLARDVDVVAAPILEYSPLLSDSDLIEIITSAHARHALVAVAKRRELNASVSEVIAATLDVPAISTLLANATAQIRGETLDKIIDHAAGIREWHLPLVLRPDLSHHAVRRVAGFVGMSLIDRLARRNNLDRETQDLLQHRLRARIDDVEDDLAEPSAASVAAAVAARFASGTLDDAYVESEVEAGRRDAVVSSLALLCNIAEATVKRVLGTRSAKSVTALVWYAGLSMRTAYKIQTLLLKLQGNELLPARNGVGFPLGEDEMRWHLNYFSVPISPDATAAE